MTVNPLYLSRLGLGKEHLGPAGGPSGVLARSTWAQHLGPAGTAADGNRVKPAGQPVIASSVEKEKWEDAVAFMESVAKHMSGYHLVMFDLSSSEIFNVLVSVFSVYNTIQLYCLYAEKFAFWLIIYIKTFNTVNNKTTTQ